MTLDDAGVPTDVPGREAPLRHRPPVARVATDVVARDAPGRRWWEYRRPPVARAGSVESRSAGEPERAPGTIDVVERSGVDGNGASSATGERGGAAPSERSRANGSAPGADQGSPRSGVPGSIPGTVALLSLAGIVVNARYFFDDFNGPGMAYTLTVVFGVTAAMAFGARLRIRRPDEPWLPRLLVLGVSVKLAASIARYLTLVDGFGGVGDAQGYHRWGLDIARGVTDGPSSRSGTDFVRWFTGQVYQVVGPEMVTGFLVFGLFAFVGSYCWYRATVRAVPFVNPKLYAALVFFAPSIAFWPSSIGKESLMALGVGVVALGISHILDQRLLAGLVLGGAGGWLVWVVRPHLLALVVLAGVVAFITGRSVARGGSSSLLRPVVMVVLALVGVLVVNEAARFLGIEELSVSSIEEQLDETTERTSQGGSEFETGRNSLSPLRIPHGVATVLFRPFPWEAESGFQLLASMESVAFGLLFLWRLPAVAAGLRRARQAPFLIFCFTLTAFYGLAFASFANFGLLVRQRSLMLPAFFALLAIDVARARASGRDEDEDRAFARAGRPGHLTARSG